MILTLVTGEKIKVLESFEFIEENIFPKYKRGHLNIAHFTSIRNGNLKYQYGTLTHDLIKEKIYIDIDKIVSYEETNT